MITQLNPNMIYSLYNHEMGSEDAYSRVLGPEHRETVKEAFNAMFQANTELNSKPSKLNLDEIGMSWMVDMTKPYFNGKSALKKIRDNNESKFGRPSLSSLLWQSLSQRTMELV